MDRKKKIIWRIVFWAIVMLVAWQIIGPYDYDCYRCGASRTGAIIYSIHPSATTIRLEKLGRKTCDHDWILNSSMLGCADCFASSKIPVIVIREWGFSVIEKMPDNNWKQEILDCLTDKNNKLKWLLAVVLSSDGFHNLDRDSKSWEEWRSDFEDLFHVEYDPVKADKKGVAILKTFKKRYNYSPESGSLIKFWKDVNRTDFFQNP